MHPHLALVRQILKRSLIFAQWNPLGVGIRVAFQIAALLISRGERWRIVYFPNTVLMRILTHMSLVTLSLGARASVFRTFTVLLYFDIGRREI